MDKRRLYLIITGAVLLLGVVLYITNRSDESPEVSEGIEGEKTILSKNSSSGFMNFPDAPAPESDESREVARLWPHALEPQDPKRKEKVKEEWQDFARRYPNNIYIPQEIRVGNLTTEEEKEILETLDSFTGVDSQFASFAAANRYAAPGSEAPAGPISEKDANPKEMTRYFDYKIKELESRIQLIEYTIEKSRMSSIDEGTAKKDMEIWKKELANLKEMQATIPKT